MTSLKCRMSSRLSLSLFLALSLFLKSNTPYLLFIFFHVFQLTSSIFLFSKAKCVNRMVSIDWEITNHSHYANSIRLRYVRCLRRNTSSAMFAAAGAKVSGTESANNRFGHKLFISNFALRHIWWKTRAPSHTNTTFFHCPIAFASSTISFAFHIYDRTYSYIFNIFFSLTLSTSRKLDTPHTLPLEPLKMKLHKARFVRHSKMLKIHYAFVCIAAVAIHSI